MVSFSTPISFCLFCEVCKKMPKDVWYECLECKTILCKNEKCFQIAEKACRKRDRKYRKAYPFPKRAQKSFGTAPVSRFSEFNNLQWKPPSYREGYTETTSRDLVPYTKFFDWKHYKMINVCTVNWRDYGSCQKVRPFYRAITFNTEWWPIDDAVLL